MIIQMLRRGSNAAEHRYSWCELHSPTEAHWSTTKSDGVWEILLGLRHKIIDIKYTLRPDLDFVSETKKANARAIRLSKALPERAVLLSL